MKYIREGRMGPPFSFKTGAVVGTYPKPMLVFLFDEEGLSVIPSRNVPSVPGNIPLDCVYEDITRIKPSEIGDYLLKEPPTKITAVDFCDTIDKQMTTDLVPVKNRAPFDSFATMLNKIVTHDNQGKPLPWKTIVLDPLTRFNDIAWMFVCAVAPTDFLKDNRTSFPLVSNKIQQFIGVITALHAHVVIIMHVQADKDEKLGSVMETPMFFGSYRQKIHSQFTGMFYAVKENGRPVIRTRNYNYAKGIGARFPADVPDPCQPDFNSIYGKENVK